MDLPTITTIKILGYVCCWNYVAGKILHSYYKSSARQLYWTYNCIEGPTKNCRQCVFVSHTVYCFYLKYRFNTWHPKIEGRFSSNKGHSDILWQKERMMWQTSAASQIDQLIFDLGPTKYNLGKKRWKQQWMMLKLVCNRECLIKNKSV